MKRSAIPLSTICVAMFVMAIASTAHADVKPLISNCTTINQSGSYLVVADLQARSTDNACLTILASFVTIDLGGYTIFCNGAAVGITNTTPPGYPIGPDNITVRNGSITGCGTGAGGGIVFFGHNYRVESVQTVSNPQDGIYMSSDGPGPINATIRNNISSNNGARGIVIFGAGGNVEGNTVNGNGQYGLVVVCPAVVLANVATGNGVVNGDIVIEGICTSDHNWPAP